MMDLSVKISSYKCFSEGEHGFDVLCPINLIIGRNNTGKSTLLELIERTTTGNIDFPEHLWHGKQAPQIILEAPLTAKEIQSVFRRDRAEGEISGNHWTYGQVYIGKRLKWKLGKGRESVFLAIEEYPQARPPITQLSGYIGDLARAKENPLHGKIFQHILAERDILPEADESAKLSVKSNGAGTTNIIQNFINKANLPSDLIEKTLLNELNSIMAPDAHFIDIVCQQLDDGRWEIYLEEERKGRVPLSHTGSGLKTVILVLVYIYLIPVVLEKPLSDLVFGFEELENNLHPALLRRLFSYLAQKAIEYNSMLFLTTHSHVAIDLFSKSARAQILHVLHNGGESVCQTVQTYTANKGILDDLDVRASDLLLSNGIIWVEGPSDRIYFNKWIHLWSKGALQEGTHYQCVFYGGSLLAHLSSEEPELVEEAVSILRVSRNAIILMDSDKRNNGDALKARVKRVNEEAERIPGLLPWVTDGKEIENYIPVEAVASLLGTSVDHQVGQFEDFFDYLGQIQAGAENRRKKKADFAFEVSQYLTKENLKQVLNLEEQLEQACTQIKAWNNL